MRIETANDDFLQRELQSWQEDQKDFEDIHDSKSADKCKEWSEKIKDEIESRKPQSR